MKRKLSDPTDDELEHNNELESDHDSEHDDDYGCKRYNDQIRCQSCEEIDLKRVNKGNIEHYDSIFTIPDVFFRIIKTKKKDAAIAMMYEYVKERVGDYDRTWYDMSLKNMLPGPGPWAIFMADNGDYDTDRDECLIALVDTRSPLISFINLHIESGCGHELEMNISWKKELLIIRIEKIIDTFVPDTRKLWEEVQVHLPSVLADIVIGYYPTFYIFMRDISDMLNDSRVEQQICEDCTNEIRLEAEKADKGGQLAATENEEEENIDDSDEETQKHSSSSSHVNKSAKTYDSGNVVIDDSWTEKHLAMRATRHARDEISEIDS